MRLLNLYIRILNWSKGTELRLTWASGEYMVIGKMHFLTEVKVSSSNRSILVDTLKKMDKFAKAHFELQTWKGAQAVTRLMKAGIPESLAAEIIGEYIKRGGNPEKISQHPEYIAVLKKMMNRG